jgi:hypothetical protein
VEQALQNVLEEFAIAFEHGGKLLGIDLVAGGILLGQIKDAGDVLHLALGYLEHLLKGIHLINGNDAIAEFPRLKLTGAYGFGVGTHMENRDGQVRFVLAKKVCVSLSANEGGIFAALARASSSPVNPRESDQHAADEKYVTLGQLPGQQFARWVC